MDIIKKLIKNRTLYGMLIVIVFWYMLHFSIDSNMIPSPHETFRVFFKLMQKDLITHLAVSTYRITVALLISLVIGVPLGLWTGYNRKLDLAISPVAYILYPLPKIAFLPIFMILFGLGDLAKIILITTIVVFQIQLAARDGVKEIPKELYYSMKTLGLSNRQIFRELVFPAALPKLMSTLRTSIGISISALFLSENFATTYGIGYFIMNSWIMVDYKSMFAGILALSILGLFLFKMIDILEKKLCPWLFINRK